MTSVSAIGLWIVLAAQPYAPPASGFGAEPAVLQRFTIYPGTPLLDAAIRGQSPANGASPGVPYEEPPATTNGGGTTLPYAPSPYAPGGAAPYQSPPLFQDPFSAPPMLGIPGLTAPPMTGGVYGANGPRPFRFGWSSYADVAFLPKERTSDAPGPLGQFGIFEVNTELRYTAPITYDWVMSVAPQFNLRLWEGPTAASHGLPGHVFRFGLDMALETPASAGWSAKLVFNPSINSDLQQQLTRQAWNFDGYGMLMYRANPQWLLVGGAGFWDRVKDRVIPYAGVVFTPDDIWEFRILFPEARISAFLGNYCGVSNWIYVTGEYNVESYQIKLLDQSMGLTVRREQIEIEDWRILLGLKTEAAGFTSFIEAGWVFGRDVDFANGTAGFDISSGFIARGGFRY